MICSVAGCSDSSALLVFKRARSASQFDSAQRAANDAVEDVIMQIVGLIRVPRQGVVYSSFGEG